MYYAYLRFILCHCCRIFSFLCFYLHILTCSTIDDSWVVCNWAYYKKCCCECEGCPGSTQPCNMDSRGVYGGAVSGQPSSSRLCGYGHYLLCTHLCVELLCHGVCVYSTLQDTSEQFSKVVFTSLYFYPAVSQHSCHSHVPCLGGLNLC